MNPAFAGAHYNLANALKEQGQFTEAIQSYRRAVERNPGYAEAHNNLGNLLKDLGQTEEAIACYERALHGRPGFADAHNNLGNALKQQGRRGGGNHLLPTDDRAEPGPRPGPRQSGRST